MVKFQGLPLLRYGSRMILYHLTRNNLACGDLIEPGNWGRVLRQTGSAHHCWEREETLERIRLAEFPDKPSRYDAAFAFTDSRAALWWWRHERRNDRGYCVELADPSARFHVGDLLGVNPVQGVDASPEDAARRYWRRSAPTFLTPDQIAISEVVTASPLRVVSLMETPDFDQMAAHIRVVGPPAT